jgi:hypothetical protein
MTMSDEDFVDEEQTAAADTEQELARDNGDNWFVRELGDGWVAAGDGIYYPPSAARQASLDEALRDAIPTEPQSESEHDAGERVGRRRFWRR